VNPAGTVMEFLCSKPLIDGPALDGNATPGAYRTDR
jgi:hypothetical protein